MANPLTINTLLKLLSHRPAGRTSRFSWRTQASAALGLTAILGGCATAELPKTEPAAPVAVVPVARPAALTPEAESALQAAEQRVAEARAKRSLWTAAVEHLDKARAAAKVFDSKATLEHAKETIELCALSIQQLLLPPVKW